MANQDGGEKVPAGEAIENPTTGEGTSTPAKDELEDFECKSTSSDSSSHKGSVKAEKGKKDLVEGKKSNTDVEDEDDQTDTDQEEQAAQKLGCHSNSGSSDDDNKSDKGKGKKDSSDDENKSGGEEKKKSKKKAARRLSSKEEEVMELAEKISFLDQLDCLDTSSDSSSDKEDKKKKALKKKLKNKAAKNDEVKTAVIEPGVVAPPKEVNIKEAVKPDWDDSAPKEKKSILERIVGKFPGYYKNGGEGQKSTASN